MSFGGAQGMITSLKNNAKQRSNKAKFKSSYKTVTPSKAIVLKFPDATPEMLDEIKTRLKVERKKRIIQEVILFVVLVILIVVVFKFFILA
ncbi:hypothetical protein [Lacinutrix undariae]